MRAIDLPVNSKLPQKYGRKLEARQLTNKGRRVGARPMKAGEHAQPLDLGRSLNAAMIRRATSVVERDDPQLSPSDLHLQVRSHKPHRLIVFVIDASDSMGDGPTARMSAALGASLAIAGKSYLSRDQVCLITFRDKEAQLIVPPTNSVSRLKEQLKKIPVGGATPLSSGLQKAGQVIRQARIKNQQVTPLLVLISDGEATASIAPGANPGTEALILAEQLQKERVPVLLIDTQSSSKGQNLMPRLAATFNTVCHQVHNLQADRIMTLIEETEVKSQP